MAVVRIDTRELVRELVAAVRADADLRRQLVEALGVETVKANDRYVSPATYAREHVLGVSTVRAAIRAKRLPAVRVGRAVRIPADAQIAPASNGDRALLRAEARLGLAPRKS
jgi:hypothetical protein